VHSSPAISSPSSALPPALSLYKPLENAERRIVAFSHAGGAGSAFAKLRLALAPFKIELCALQSPGRENRTREPFAQSLHDLAEEFAGAITKLPPLPTTYLGHSMGGLAAFLTAQIAPPERLIASASVSPARRTYPLSTHNLPDAAFRERLFSMGGVPREIRENPSFFAMFEAALRADYRLFDTYVYGDEPPLSCPIHAYCGTTDKAVSTQGVAAWQLVAQSKIQIRKFDGGHFFLYQQLDRVVACLREDLS